MSAWHSPLTPQPRQGKSKRGALAVTAFLLPLLQKDRMRGFDVSDLRSPDSRVLLWAPSGSCINAMRPYGANSTRRASTATRRLLRYRRVRLTLSPPPETAHHQEAPTQLSYIPALKKAAPDC